MNKIATAIEHLDWQNICVQLDREGFAVLPGILGLPELPEDDCHAQFPGLLSSLKNALYPPLAHIANQWNEILQLPYRYPRQLSAFEGQCLAVGQLYELSQLSCLREGEYLELRQDADGEHVFPLQLVTLLSSPGKDFTGGELVLTELRPRMQSRPMVVPLRYGDIAIITTAQRPFKGSKGYYRVNMKHAISRVRSGERRGFSLSFHFAPESIHG
ncbi:2OG-Fe(II) oxygenase [Pseudomonas costantinii]|uniref:2OG-Fe(II) oxygenase n=1 Tax=Pseudomonas costantinii TaxID=168469 RepID=UPI0015A01371|nr:2OG-Fe(II) oxygenase [Pseudomonas costantinii]NVZ69246.1 2OG-Fe(II) oxygenase [Pseudomonas costantinii]